MAKVEMYFDGSGKAGDQSFQYIALLGVVATADVWRSFELKWKEVLDVFQVDQFHMTDAWAGRGDYKGWDKAKVRKRDRLIMILVA